MFALADLPVAGRLPAPANYVVLGEPTREMLESDREGVAGTKLL